MPLKIQGHLTPIAYFFIEPFSGFPVALLHDLSYITCQTGVHFYMHIVYAKFPCHMSTGYQSG